MDERFFSDSFSNLDLKAFGWGFEILNLELILIFQLFNQNYTVLQMLTLVLFFQNTEQNWTFRRDTRLLVWRQLVNSIARLLHLFKIISYHGLVFTLTLKMCMLNFKSWSSFWCQYVGNKYMYCRTPWCMCYVYFLDLFACRESNE